MVGLPKKKISSARRGQRRSHDHIVPPPLMNCPQCRAAQADPHGVPELRHVQRHRRAAPRRQGQAEAGVAALALLALLFPGQASQAVGMGTDLQAASPNARRLFDAGRRGHRPADHAAVRRGPARATDRNRRRPASGGHHQSGRAGGADASESASTGAVAGHSVGEFAAYVAAGVFDDEAALRLVHARAQAMAAACASGRWQHGRGDRPGRGAAARGVPRSLASTAASVEIANLNAPGQLIVSGARDAIERLGDAAQRPPARGACCR